MRYEAKSRSCENMDAQVVCSYAYLRALRLGVTNITVKSGSNRCTYTITVVPAKQGDVHLNQEILMGLAKADIVRESIRNMG